MVSQVKYIRISILKSGIKDSLRIMLVKRKIRKILSKSLIPYFLNSFNKDKEILVKRSALYHYIARLDDGMANANGWLKMMVQIMVVSNTLLRNQSTFQKGQSDSLPFPLVAGRSNGCFNMVQQPWFLVSQTYLPMLCTTTYLTR